MKDSSGDWNNTKVFLDAFGKSGFDVFVGSESFLLANMRNGGVGCISATANVNPAPIDKLYANGECRCGCQQAELNVTRNAYGKKYPMIGALKQALRTTRRILPGPRCGRRWSNSRGAGISRSPRNSKPCPSRCRD